MGKPNCKRCKGRGFYLYREERFYDDGSYRGNDWHDCGCPPDAQPHDARNTYRIGGREYRL